MHCTVSITTVVHGPFCIARMLTGWLVSGERLAAVSTWIQGTRFHRKLWRAPNRGWTDLNTFLMAKVAVSAKEIKKFSFRKPS